MTKSEKRFFKLSSSLQSGEKNYLKIFDCIDDQEEYDEQAIKDEFKGETFVRHFPSEKNHLYKLILKSLRAYHSDDSISSILKQEIKNIEILYKKALYKECDKFLTRAKKLAVTHEKFYYLFELLNWEKLLLEEAYEEGEFSTDLDGLIREEQEVIEKLRNLAAYHVLYSKMNYVFRSGGFVRNEADRMLVNEISGHLLIRGKNTALSRRAATICYYIQGFCAMANLEKEKAYEKFMRVKEILDDHPPIRRDLPKRYVRTLSQLISILIDTGKVKEARKMIDELRNISKQKGFRTESIKVMVFKSAHLAELRLPQRTGDFQKGLELVKRVENGLDELDMKINKEQELLFFYNISLTYFGAGEHKMALFWLNKLLNDNENNLRQDIYSYARLYNLVIHYELGNYDLLDYIIKSTSRYLNKRQRHYEMESLVLNYMKRLAKLAGGSGIRQVFTEFYEDLADLLDNDSDKVILEYFDYPTWIMSKIRGKSFGEMVKYTFENNGKRPELEKEKTRA